MIKTEKLYIFALAAHGEGISGGDRIFMELSRRWSKRFPIEIFLWEEGYKMCQRQKLAGDNLHYHISNLNRWSRFGFTVNYLIRIIEGLRLGLLINLKNSEKIYIYNASEFWMDSLPAFILKLRFPKIRWVASWFQTSPNPLKGFSEGRYRLRAFLYWFAQMPIKPLVSNFADFVLVNNEEERKQFPNLNKRRKVIVVIGAVSLKEIRFWQKTHKPFPKVYDAVFQGRFHPQKGVVELIQIWKHVVDRLPRAKLAMIGDGPLKKDVKLRINAEKLEKNVNLLGYLFDGPKKYKIFSQSKLVVHPAFYDSGGMAAAEAMAFGIPAVGFDLESFQSYYPKGMVKVKEGDLNAFANAIMSLIGDKNEYNKTARDANEMLEKNWSWDKRAKEVLNEIQK